jgi:mycoredoxin
MGGFMNQNDLYTRQPSQIVMYGVDWCPDCRRARFFFKRKNIPYLDVNIDENEQAAAFVKEINGGMRSVPTIIFPDGSLLVEPSEAQLEEKFATLSQTN